MDNMEEEMVVAIAIITILMGLLCLGISFALDMEILR